MQSWREWAGPQKGLCIAEPDSWLSVEEQVGYQRIGRAEASLRASVLMMEGCVGQEQDIEMNGWRVAVEVLKDTVDVIIWKQSSACAGLYWEI